MNGARAAVALDSVSSQTCGMLRPKTTSKAKSISSSSRLKRLWPRISFRSRFRSSLMNSPTSRHTPRSKPGGCAATEREL